MLWGGEQRFVHLTVAGADGGGVGSDNELYRNLLDGIASAPPPGITVLSLNLSSR